MVRKPIFWILFVVVSLGSTAAAYHYFPTAFPIVNVDLRMDRDAALESAGNLAEKYGWGPSEYRMAASFGVDSRIQSYVELEGGGIEAFSRMIEGTFYSPYTWRVRLFREDETNETTVWFTPAGEAFGFTEKLPEDQPGPSLAKEEARKIAESRAVSDWSVPMQEFELVENPDELRPGGRTDHTFVYERKAESIGEAKYRLRLTVAGDRFVELRHFVKIPEAFDRRYEEMRSANDTIAFGSTIAMGILYLLGGCFVGLFFLLRQRWVLWKQPLFWGSLIGFLQVLVGINRIPIAWMGYDTALSASSFLFQQLAAALANGVLMGILMTLSFMAAESLTRKAFPDHIQLWKIWSKDVAPSQSVLGRTMAGYLLIGIFFAYEVALYFSTTKFLGWWSPSSALFEPDTLATYFPWLTSIAVSAQAGFWEESLFRAVPIAGAALLGQRYGRRKLWIFGALILQALIFGAGHANYPAQPAYARVVELIIPSFTWGLIYIYYGLLPAVVMHFAYDVVWFALPLFVSTAPGIWIDQVLVVILAWKPAPPLREETESVVESMQAPAVRSIPLLPVLAAGILGVIAWALTTPFSHQALPLEVDRETAVSAALAELDAHGFQLEPPWKVLSTVEVPLNDNDRFIWQKGGPEAYNRLMGSYLQSPFWKIRVVRFEGDVAERAEEYEVWVNGKGEMIRTRNRIPEARRGASLEQEEARAVVERTIRDQFGLNVDELVQVSSEPSKLENRRDWTFTFRDEMHYPVKEGEARISVVLAGDEVTDAYQFVYVPEEWQREERSRRSLLSIFSIGCSALIGLAVFAGAITAVVNWSRRRFAIRAFLVSFGIFLLLSLMNLVNSWPNITAQFSSAQPFKNQVLVFVLGGLIGVLFMALAVALVVGMIHYWNRNRLAAAIGTGSLLRGLSLGASLGAAAAGVTALVRSLTAESEPIWADYQAASAQFPLLSDSLGPISSLILNTAVLLLVIGTADRLSEQWSCKKATAAALLIFAGIVFAGTGSISSIPYWIISGVVTGVVILLLYVYVLRFDWAIVPAGITAVMLLGQVKTIALQPYPSAVPGGILAIVLLSFAGILWCRILGNVTSRLGQRRG